jgi:hypothetical protein
VNTAPEAEPGTTTSVTVAHEEESDPAAATSPFPWPPGERDPIVGGFIDTWRAAVLHPAPFFAAMPGSLSLGAALLYYLVVGVLGAALRLFWTMVLPASESTLLGELLGSAVQATPLVDFLASPLYLLLSLYLAAGVTHLLLLALVPGQRGFGTTLRVFCFAYSPVLFGVVPYLGSLVAFIWMTALSIIGVRAAHGTTRGRAATVVLLPLALAMVFLAIAVTLFSRAAGLLGQ